MACFEKELAEFVVRLLIFRSESQSLWFVTYSPESFSNATAKSGTCYVRVFYFVGRAANFVGDALSRDESTPSCVVRTVRSTIFYKNQERHYEYY